MTKVRIDVVSDVACPWCYVGKRRLETALAARPDIEAEVHWRPYMLDPTIPAGGYPRADYMAAKFGSAERAAAMFERVSAEAANEGLAFDMAAMTVSPNTLDAHRLVHWAAEAGLQDAMKEALLKAFFVEARDVGDIDVLVEIAEAVGLSSETVRARLATDEDVARIEADIAEARQIGVTGVPCFIIDRRAGLSGAQSPAAILAAIDGVIAERGASGRV